MKNEDSTLKRFIRSLTINEYVKFQKKYMRIFVTSEKVELEDLTEAEAGCFITNSNGIAAPDEIIEPTKNVIYL